MAHGQDVANLGEIRGVEAASRWVVARSAALIANSRWLAARLGSGSRRRPRSSRSIDCGVDLDAFTPADQAAARAELGWEGDGPAFLCVGSLIERKNVVRLADAFARLGRGRLAFVGDGPLRGALEGRAGSASSAGSRRPRSPAGSPPVTSSASRRWSSPSARRRSRRWRWSATSSRPRSAARRSSSRPRPGCWSTRSTTTRSPRPRAGGGATVPEPGRPRGRRRARRPPPGGADGRGARARVRAAG